MDFPFIKIENVLFLFMILLTNNETAECQLIINVSSGEQGAVSYRQTVSGELQLFIIFRVIRAFYQATWPPRLSVFSGWLLLEMGFISWRISRQESPSPPSLYLGNWIWAFPAIRLSVSSLPAQETLFLQRQYSSSDKSTGKQVNTG